MTQIEVGIANCQSTNPAVTQWIHALAITILSEAFATDPEHLDGKRVVVFLFNFFDELRRKVPLGR